jgi:hypothetical protein
MFIKALTISMGCSPPLAAMEIPLFPNDTSAGKRQGTFSWPVWGHGLLDGSGPLEFRFRCV